MMKRVTRQEFIRYTSKYLKEFPFIVTNRGDDDFVVADVNFEDCAIYKDEPKECCTDDNCTCNT